MINAVKLYLSFELFHNYILHSERNKYFFMLDYTLYIVYIFNWRWKQFFFVILQFPNLAESILWILFLLINCWYHKGVQGTPRKRPKKTNVPILRWLYPFHPFLKSASGASTITSWKLYTFFLTNHLFWMQWFNP